jgi:hypothetical protein
VLDMRAKRITGVVNQLKFGDHGCWEVSTPATHRFTLDFQEEVRRGISRGCVIQTITVESIDSLSNS